uniref:PITH domain-containing protein n=1 Tax=Wuchereria bancrofti TaxID=6293 RepID=A0AAF5Q243_WUCBA
MLSASLLLHYLLIQQSIHSTNEMKFNKSGRHKEEVLEFINLSFGGVDTKVAHF